jgi:DnaJ domain
MSIIYKRTTRALPADLDKLETFVIARINGKLTVEDLLILTNVLPFELDLVLASLVARGLVIAATPTPAVSAKPNHANEAPKPATVGARAPEPPVDLDATQQERILALHVLCETGSHYELLGLAPDADKKAIKRAYFQLTTHVHPDRFFRKQLGAFKPRMEVIFARVTEAHDVLSNAEQRAEYDEYLGALQRAAKYERVTENVNAERLKALRDLEAIARADSARNAPPAAAPASAAASSASLTAAPIAATPKQPERSVDAAPSSSAHLQAAPPSATQRAAMPAANAHAPVAVVPPLSDAGKREALARKLLGDRGKLRAGASNHLNGAAVQPEATASNPVSSAADAAVAQLKERYEARLSNAKSRKVREAIETSQINARAGDLPGAIASLRLALSLAPDEPGLAGQVAKLQADADEALVVHYRTQATYEERQNKFADAGRTYAKLATLLKNDALAWDRCAHFLLRAGTDLHSAADAARKATELAPESGEYWLTLATVYADASLASSARAAFSRAEERLGGSPTLTPIRARLAALRQ